MHLSQILFTFPARDGHGRISGANHNKHNWGWTLLLAGAKEVFPMWWGQHLIIGIGSNLGIIIGIGICITIGVGI